jgi:hypothetical protein
VTLARATCTHGFRLERGAQSIARGSLDALDRFVHELVDQREHERAQLAAKGVGHDA